MSDSTDTGRSDGVPSDAATPTEAIATLTPASAPAHSAAVLMEGRFRLYETPHGGYKLVYRVDGDTEDRPHIDVPAMMVKAAKAMGDKGPGKIASAFGMKG